MLEESEGRWAHILLIYGLGVFASMVVSEATPVLSAMAREFHPKNPATVGWFMSLPAVVVALSALPVGWLVDRFGDFSLLLIGGVILIAGDLSVVAAGSVQAVLAARVVGGAGDALMVVAAVTLLTRLTKGRRRTAALALWSTFVPVSFAIPFLFGPILLAHWRWSFLGHVGCLGLFLVLGFLALPRRGANQPIPSRIAGLKAVLGSPLPYALGLSFAAAACLQTGVVSTVSPFIAGHTGFTEAQIQPFNTVGMLFNVAGGLCVGQLLNRGIAPWVIGFGGTVLAGAAGLILYLAPAGLAQMLALDFAFMLGCGFLVGTWALLPVVAPSPGSIGATSGLITQITLFGVLFGAPGAIVALSKGPGSMAAFIVATVVLCLAGAPVWLRPFHRGEGAAAH